MLSVLHDNRRHSQDATICAMIITLSTRISGLSTSCVLAAWLLGLATLPAADPPPTEPRGLSRS
jgi:hypothetical protein